MAWVSLLTIPATFGFNEYSGTLNDEVLFACEVAQRYGCTHDAVVDGVKVRLFAAVMK